MNEALVSHPLTTPQTFAFPLTFLLEDNGHQYKYSGDSNKTWKKGLTFPTLSKTKLKKKCLETHVKITCTTKYKIPLYIQPQKLFLKNNNKSVNIYKDLH